MRQTAFALAFPFLILSCPALAQEAERRALETERRVLEAERRVQHAERRAAEAEASASTGAGRAPSQSQRHGCETAKRTYQSLCSRREMETGAEARECHAAAADVRNHCAVVP